MVPYSKMLSLRTQTQQFLLNLMEKTCEQKIWSGTLINHFRSNTQNLSGDDHSYHDSLTQRWTCKEGSCFMLIILRNVFICKCIYMLSSLLVGGFLVTVITIFSFCSSVRESKPTSTSFFSTILEDLFSYKKQFQQHLFCCIVLASF